MLWLWRAESDQDRLPCKLAACPHRFVAHVSITPPLIFFLSASSMARSTQLLWLSCASYVYDPMRDALVKSDRPERCRAITCCSCVVLFFCPNLLGWTTASLANALGSAHSHRSSICQPTSHLSIQSPCRRTTACEALSILCASLFKISSFMSGNTSANMPCHRGNCMLCESSPEAVMQICHPRPCWHRGLRSLHCILVRAQPWICNLRYCILWQSPCCFVFADDSTDAPIAALSGRRPSSSDDTWYRFNDAKVSVCREDDAIKANFGGKIKHRSTDNSIARLLSAMSRSKPSAYSLVYCRCADAARCIPRHTPYATVFCMSSNCGHDCGLCIA